MEYFSVGESTIYPTHNFIQLRAGKECEAVVIIIAHRVNTIEQLQEVPRHLGVEVDLRTRGNEIIVHHDPWLRGLPFRDWLQAFEHRFIILNVKEEGLEPRLLEELKFRRIEEFFFLDQSFPFLIRTALEGESRCAVRVSEFESIETAMALAGKVNWVWVDCFTRFPLSGDQASCLQKAGFKLCFVSPELQGRDDPDHIREFRKQIEMSGISGDAICTKMPTLWA